MSHTIKLEDHIFNQLEDFRDKRETYSQAVERLLGLPAGILSLAGLLEGQAALEQRKSEQLKGAAVPH